jgi:signal transduction histidine kinase/DNA-binding response OmpR family regulator
MKTTVLKHCLAAFVLAASVSCSTHQEPQYRIGFSQCVSGDSWRKNMQESMMRELSFYPEISLEISHAEGDFQKQNQQIQAFIDKKVDVLIVSANDKDAHTPLIEKAFLMGIPVIILDRRISSDKYTAFVGAENELVGQNAGSYANTLLAGKGTILEIATAPNSSPTIGRHSGFLKALKKYPDLHFTASFWFEGNFQDSLATYLNQHPSLDLIFAHNDRFALETQQVCKRLHLTDKIKIIGVDGLAGPDEGLDMVNRGMINATILYPTGGEEAIQTAVKILKKQPFRRENKLFTTVITPENVGIMLSQIKKIKEQQQDIKRQSSKIQYLNDTYSSQRNRLYFISALLTVVAILGAVMYFLLREKQRSNRVLAKQNLEILEQKNKIESVSQLAQKAIEDKMRFYSYISHEFKTPLSLILTPAEDLLQHKTFDARETRNTLQLIQKNAHRLLRLVDQFLDLRKLDAGKMELQAGQYDLAKFIKDIINDFSLKAKAKQIDLQFICPFKELPFWFDTEKLDKVLFNIISNAFKYTPEGGFIHVSILQNTHKIEINIADNGVGMNEEEKEHAFDLFYRGNNNSSLGTGLGLALSREFVTLHEGTIHIESQKGKGTTFKITLPFNKSTQNSTEIPAVSSSKADLNIVEHNPPIRSQASGSRFENTLILIEDNRDLSLFLSEKLAQIYNVVVAETAEKGWEEIMAHIPDLIVSDVMLPGMDGFALTQKLKSDFRTSHIPVVLLTAKSQIENQIEGTKAGADAYLTKPFNQQLLEEKLKGLLGNRAKMKQHFSTEISPGNRLQKGERKFLLEFEALIDKNMKANTLSVEKLSQELGMSRVQLFRKISALTDKNVTDYIADYKIQKAKVLLNDHRKNITEIAYELGFNNPNYFTTFFKQKTDKTPSEWRNGGV